MTEAEWLACTDPLRMTDYLSERGNDRKLRLFACARCRQLWHLLTDHRSRLAVEVGERFADRQATTAELNEAAEAAWRAKADEVGGRVALSAVVEHDPTGNGVWDTAWDLGGDSGTQEALMVASSKEIQILRDIFGNPFRPIALDPAWRTPTVVSLAQTAYDERLLPAGTLQPDRLAVLADALEEAGCGEANLLAHCRQPGVHVQGCWVVDLLLVKE